MRKPLTVKQEKFAQEYVANGGNASDAYRAAYNTSKMKPASVWRLAHDVLMNVNVSSRIDEIRKEIEEKSNVSAVWIRERLMRLVERCMQADPVLDGDGEPTGEYRFDSSGANKAMDTLNKMQGYYAKLEIEHSGTINFESEVLQDL
jgi:phage terminase small subunit